MRKKQMPFAFCAEVISKGNKAALDAPRLQCEASETDERIYKMTRIINNTVAIAFVIFLYVWVIDALK